MQFGVILPTDVDPRMLAEIAYQAEATGWDGVFVWDGIYGHDPWVTLAAMTMRTERVRLGPLVTPPSRRRPWKLAQETASLDHLSGGRLVLAVGLGAPGDAFRRFGEETDRKRRAQMLDESLALLTHFWSGQPFSYRGAHYRIDDVTFEPTPLQQPRIPIWVVGAWPFPKSMSRALHYDGLIPYTMNGDRSYRPTTPDDVRAMKAYIDQHRVAATPYDIVLEQTLGDDPDSNSIRPFAEAGATWLLDNVWEGLDDRDRVAGMQRRVRRGPPKL
jgi:alkanesulfonate monooxygenase SsuD/methylene tetrahydromethanopterin reductase-like flavin-dependent oxidoreductase (luciferase family)